MCILGNLPNGDTAAQVEQLDASMVFYETVHLCELFETFYYGSGIC